MGQDSGETDQERRPTNTNASGGRAEKSAAAVLKRYRTREEGEQFFDRMRRADQRDAAAAEFDFPAGFSAADLEEMHRLCLRSWKMSFERDVGILFQHTMEECGSMMDADRQFRLWQHKIDHGKKQVQGRDITHEIIAETQGRIQAYWSKVTPGNVSLIVDNLSGKCLDWDSAEKKFDWLWKKGEWESNGKTAKINGRMFTVEDLQQAERRCRSKFGLAATISHRVPPTQRQEAPRRQPVVAAAAAAPASVAEESAAPAPVSAATVPAPAVAEAPTVLSNEDFIVEHILKKCSSMDGAKKFFAWLRSDTGKKIRGRSFTPEDVSNAERRCREKWESEAKEQEKEEGSSESSDSEESGANGQKAPSQAMEAAQQAKESAPANAESHESHVEAITAFVLKKYKSMAKAERCFDTLNQTCGEKNFLGLVCTQEEVTEAFLKAQEEFENRQAAKKQKTKAASEAPAAPAEAGPDFIVKYVMKKFSTMEKAERCFEQLQSEAGEKSHLGPVFSVEEITEAWIRCIAEFDEKNAAPAEQPREEKKKSKKDLNNSDFIIHHIMRKCDNANKAEKFFDMLHGTVGQENPLGRIFTAEDVTEAWLRCNAYFEEQAQEVESSESGSDGGSSSESSAPRRGRAPKERKAKRQGKQKKISKRRSKLVDDELQGALFGSDDESLSGEELVDEEDEATGAELLADLAMGEDDEPQVLDDNYPAHHWEDLAPEVLPGFDGFNSRATMVMQRAGMGSARLQVTFDAAAACPPLQPHQESVAFLLHPKSPVTRLLVDHPTGSGKTREMIKVLDNYFYDPRPKVPIFPKEPVCRNFYGELLRWPSRYRDYFCCERPADASIASGRPDWKEYRMHMWDLSGLLESELRRLIYSIRDVLEMKGMFHMGRVRRSFRVAFQKKNPGEPMPLSPLRALGYTSAGGSFSKIGENGKPLSSIMKIGYDKDSMNVYCNKIVLMDEAHNLVRSQTQYAEQLCRLRTLLFGASNLVLAGFTGTPILSEPSEGRQLLDIVKGKSAPEADDGFLSSFPMRPQPLFPLSLPRGLPDGVLTLQRKKQLITKTEIHGETLKIYEWKKRIGLPNRRLRAYCNVCTFHGSFHEGKHGTKVKILTFPEDCCPKLFAIAQAVAASPEKAVVLCGRMSGYIVMLELMKFIAMKADPPFNVATMDELSEFNHVSNLRGEAFRVLVADAAQCSEGVSFLACRRTYLADVPVSPSAFIQACGRAIRMYGHRGLGEDEQTVTNKLYVATLPKWMRSSSLGGWCLRAQKRYNSGKEVEKRARTLAARFIRAGIKTLDELKARIDAHGREKYDALAASGTVITGRDRVLTSEDVVTFLEQNGLWDEAKQLRNADKKDKEKLQNAGSKEDLERTSSMASISRMESSMSLDTPFDTQEVDDTLDADTGLGNDAEPEDKLPQAPGAILTDVPENGGVADQEKLARTTSSGEMPPPAPPAPRPPAIDPDVALEEAVRAVDAACKVMNANAPTQGQDEPNALSWRVSLEETLLRLKVSPNIVGAAKVAIHPSFIIQDGTIRELSMEQVRLLRDELHRLRKVSVLTRAVTVLKQARTGIEKSERALTKATRLEQGGSGSAGGVDHDVMEALRAEGVFVPFVSAPKVAAPGEAGITQSDAAEAIAAPVPTGSDETVVLPNDAPLAAEEPHVNDVSDLRAEAAAEEKSWREALLEGLRPLKDDPLLGAALKIAAPNFGGDDAGLRSMTPEQVRRLHDEISRLKNQEDQPPPRPRALVRAMQALYAAESAADASLTLSTETADEHALAELTERSQEFAPALQGMRSMATDKEIFSHLADKLDEDGEVAMSESEGSDICKDIDAEPAPVVLPAGWRMEWVKRKKRENREFLDPQGNRYRSVREVRIALSTWEARERAIAAAREAASGPPAKRTRLRAKVNATAMFGPGEDAADADDLMGAGGLEGLFEEALEGALEASGAGADLTDADAAALSKFPARPASAPAKPATAPARPSAKSSLPSVAIPTEPRAGVSVKLKGLVAKPELNGQLGTLKTFNAETGRWECQLAKGGKVNVKAANFDLQAGTASKRPAPGDAAGPRPRAKAKGSGRGQGQGRGDAAAVDIEEDSD